jgi:hypothetical protein
MSSGSTPENIVSNQVVRLLAPSAGDYNNYVWPPTEQLGPNLASEKNENKKLRTKLRSSSHDTRANVLSPVSCYYVSTFP